MNQSRENQTEESEHFSLGAFESATQKNKEVAFILDNVVDWSVLKDSIPEHVDVFVLNSSLDGLEQILSYLEIMPEKVLDAIHVLGHGSQANLNLGAINLNRENLSYYADVLEKIGHFLSEDGDFLLYGCNVAQGEAGRAFVEDIARITRADVAASNDVTGSTNWGGNWVLEDITGTINVVSLDLAGTYSGILPLPDGLLDVTPFTMPGSFVTGFSLTIDTSGFVAKDDDPLGIYFYPMAYDTDSSTPPVPGTFTVSADNLNVASFDLTGLVFVKYSPDGSFIFTVNATKIGGSAVSTTFSTANNSTNYTSANYTDFTGITRFSVTITPTGSDHISNHTFDSFTIANAVAPVSNTPPAITGTANPILMTMPLLYPSRP